MKKMTTNYFTIASYIFTFCAVFLSALHHPVDPDLGWHLKYGEYFFQNLSVLRENTFSTSMTDFRWINSSWGTDAISYGIYRHFGFAGLSIASALVVSASVLIFSKAFTLNSWSNVIVSALLVMLIYPLNMVSFRGQLLSMLFLGILIFLIMRYMYPVKNRIYLIPLLFLFWSNIHGAFMMGFGIFALWITIRIIINIIGGKKNILESFVKFRHAILALLLSVLTTVINPFGPFVYTESFKHFTASKIVQQSVVEWSALQVDTSVWWQQMFAGGLILFGIFLMWTKGKLREYLPIISIAILVFVLSLGVRRYVWTAYYLSVPLFASVVMFFVPQHKRKRQYPFIPFLAALMFFLFSLLNANSSLSALYSMNWDTYCHLTAHCSDAVIQRFSKINNGKYLTNYDWGGYIIWNYPEVKPSIDGRMHLWKDQSGYSAFEEYWQYEQNLTDIDSSDYSMALVSKQKPIYSRLRELTREGEWQLVYEDGRGAIFKRSLNQ